MSLEIDPQNPWPTGIGGLVALSGNVFRDPRGSILNLTEFPCGSVALIRSKANAVRSNHWHKTDAHYLVTLEGRWIYQECAPGENLSAAPRIEVNRLECVYTPPGRLHRCTFLTDTILISCSKLTRTHAEHEADVVRAG